MPVIAGIVSTTIFAASTLPMLWKAGRTKDLRSYSLGNLLLANSGNAVHSVYVFHLPKGPGWILHSFYLVSSALMLFWYLRHAAPRKGGKWLAKKRHSQFSVDNNEWNKIMPRYLVERQFKDGLDIPMNEDGASVCLGVVAENTVENVTWLHSYVTTDNAKTFCVYDGPDPEAVRRAATRNVRAEPVRASPRRSRWRSPSRPAGRSTVRYQQPCPRCANCGQRRPQRRPLVGFTHPHRLYTPGLPITTPPAIDHSRHPGRTCGALLVHGGPLAKEIAPGPRYQQCDDGSERAQLAGQSLRRAVVR